MNTLNKSYGKLLQDNYLEYAPEAFKHDGKDYIHPTAADYKMIGFLPIVKTNPSEPAPAGKHFVGEGWEATTKAIENALIVEEQPGLVVKVNISYEDYEKFNYLQRFMSKIPQ